VTPAEAREAWAAALESGEFEQGRAALATHHEDGDGGGVRYCCLGVACEVALRNGVPLEREVNMGSGRHISYDGEMATLPVRVVKFLGLGGHAGSLRKLVGNAGSLVMLNDRGATFAEITEQIRTGNLILAEERDA
jgi:hypothetical protein